MARDRKVLLAVGLVAGLMGCGGGAPVAGDGDAVQGPAEFAASEAPRIWEGARKRRNDHIGHTLIEPLEGFAGGRTVLVGGGGSPWLEVRHGPSSQRDVVALFFLDAARPGSPAGPVAALHGDGLADRFGFALAAWPGLVGAAGPGELGEGGPPDLAVGAPRGPVGERGDFTERGQVHLIAGTDLKALLARRGDAPELAPGLRILGDRDGGRFGLALAAAGDLDGDGLADLLVGQPGGHLAPGFGGRVWLVPGSGWRAIAATGAQRFPVDDPRLGARVLLEGDPAAGLGVSLALRREEVGGAALLAGALECLFDPVQDRWLPSSGEGRGHGRLVRLGAQGEVSADLRLAGAAPESHFGRAVQWARVGSQWVALVGAPFDQDGEGLRTGAVHAFGVDGEALWQLRGPQELSRFGWALAHTDGYLAVGAPNASSAGRLFADARAEPQGFRRGSLHIFAWSDAKTLPEERARWHAEGSRDHLGFSVAAAPFSHFLAGALAWPFDPGTEQGRLYLIPAAKPVGPR